MENENPQLKRMRSSPEWRANLGLGCANLGSPVNGVISIARSQQIVKKALDNGILFFDTSSQYGASEIILANALKSPDSGAAIVISKCAGDNKKDQIATSIDRFGISLWAMLIHNWFPNGKNLYIESNLMKYCAERSVKFGASTYGFKDAMEAIETGVFEYLEFEFNLLNWSSMQHVISKCNDRGIFPIIRSVLARGYLTDSCENDCPLSNEIRFLKRLAEQNGMSLEEMALRYAFEFMDRGVVLFGVDHPYQVDLNSDIALKPELDPKIIRQIADITWAIKPEKWDLRKWK